MVEIVTFTVVYSLFEGLQADLFVVLGVEAEYSLVSLAEVYRKIVHIADSWSSCFILIFDEFVFKILEVTSHEGVHEDQLFVIVHQSIAEQIGTAQYQLLFHQRIVLSKQVCVSFKVLSEKLKVRFIVLNLWLVWWQDSGRFFRLGRRSLIPIKEHECIWLDLFMRWIALILLFVSFERTWIGC